MMSELTKQINRLDLKLMALDRSERSRAHKPIAELTSIVRELSQKIDKLEDADEFLSVG